MEENATTITSTPAAETTQSAPTFDEVLKANPAYQSEFDRRLSKGQDTAVGNARTKWEQESATRIDAARTEAERLARMTADQRSEHERKAREDALMERERTITRRELRAGALELLTERGLPHKLADTLDYQSADAVKASIDAIGGSYLEALEQGIAAGVKARVSGGAPRNGTTSANAALEEQLRKSFGLKPNGDKK